MMYLGCWLSMFLAPKYRTFPDYKPSAIIALAFGRDDYNIELAKTARAAQLTFGEKLLCIGQTEIIQRANEVGLKGNLSRVGIANSTKISLAISDVDTREILKLGKTILKIKDLDISKILLIAHPAHMYRVVETARKLGISGSVFIESESGWDSTDSQLWVRGPKHWIPREIMARIYYNFRKYT
jgi:uncharacterized SAM-binding protein YcdF (DUF218 family)